MHSALQVANKLEILKEVGKFLQRRCTFVTKLLKVYPEEENELPSPGHGLQCPKEEVFQNLQMP